MLLPLQTEADAVRHNKCTSTKHHIQHVPCVKHAQLQCFWCNVYICPRQNVRQVISVALLWSSFWSSFSAWLCRSFAGVSSVAVHCLQHSGLNRQGRWCEFQSEHFRAGSVYFAPACIGCHINCCCCFLLLLACHSCA